MMFKQNKNKELVSKFKNACIQADISADMKSGPSGKSMGKRYPKILALRKTKIFDEVIFELPTGCDPKLLHKNLYTFEQYFSPNLDIEEVKPNQYHLRHYHNVKNGAFAYDFEEMKAACKGKVLPIIVGKDRLGRIIVFDLVRQPSLLIAGIIGSGKSIALRSILTHLILHKRYGLEIYLADLKMSEFTIFKNIDIVKRVDFDTSDVANTINYLYGEMLERAKLLNKYEKDHILEYNKIPGVPKKNLIIFAIDEMIMLAGKDHKETIKQLTKLVSLSRALGIYVILSMQRPDAESLEAVIKANMDVRMAFRHADIINSQISLGKETQEDASKIPKSEPGKMYCKLDKIEYLQAPYLDMDDFQFVNGKIINGKACNEEYPIFKGAKSLLQPYKVTPRTDNLSDDNFIDAVDIEDF